MSSLNAEFKKRENKILSYWKEHKIFEKSLAQTQNQKKFVFFEGPPTANGRPGIHHFLARAFKDLYGRYKTMKGYFVLRKAGWDTHGLPVELEVEKKLGFKSKKDIEEFGIEPFNAKAKESVWEYKTEWEHFTNEMGYWLDMDHPYITYDNKYIESVWQVVKRIWDKGYIYKAHKVVPFCVRCGSTLSSHEVAQGYATVEDTSVFLKFKVTGSKLKDILGSSILAWTTTPWTLPGNLALAVGKEIDYVLVEKRGGKYVLAKERLESVLGKESQIIKEFKGSDLVGTSYAPLFNVPKLRSDKSYQVYLADFVSTEDGTGVVHTAVMYGEEDYNLGTELGLPKNHTVNEQGNFIDVSADLDGRFVKDQETENVIIEYLKSHDLLLRSEKYSHEYPFCWRCSTPLLYYAKDSWFIRMSDLRDKLIENNNQINWVPDHLKDGRFGQWLKEVKDWAITRERYWGTPFPIFTCKGCGHHEAIGSLADLEEKRYRKGNKYILIRHGHSEKNGHEGKAEIISSKLDRDTYHLTVQGERDIKELVAQLKSEGVDMIFSSPFMRTKETADILGKELNLSVIVDDRVKEYDHGFDCEGKTHNACNFVHVDRDWDERHNDGETLREVKSRVAQFLLELESKYDDKTIVVVSHADTIVMMEAFGHNREEKEAVALREKDFPVEGQPRFLRLKNYPYDRNGNLDVHRPFIDSVELKCSKCDGIMKRIPDLMDVWFDSGAMPYAQWHWPFENKEMAESSMMGLKKAEQFPADFIVEAIDQTRGWFYTLLAVSTLLGNGAPYKNVMSLSHVLDEKGKKMSKSRGNVVSPFEVMEKYGADAGRWYFYTVNDVGEYKLFSLNDVELRLKNFIMMVGNCLRFYEMYSGEVEKENQNMPNSLLDRWVLSRFDSLVGYVTDRLDKYDTLNASRAIEKFVADDFSNWWLRRSRKRKEALPLLRHLLIEVCKLVAPFTPFMAEDIYLKLRTSGMPISVHLERYPEINTSVRDEVAEKEMEMAREIVTVGLAQRRSNNIKVRQPLRKVTVRGNARLSDDIENIIRDELNVKEISYSPEGESVAVLDVVLDEELIREGLAREFARQIQEMRKDAKFAVDEKVHGQWHSDSDRISAAIRQWSQKISEDTLVVLHNSPKTNETFEVEGTFDLAPGSSIYVGLRRK